jgi:chromosome condensin MukBEF ATPase and DNA-binding subunit MukB
MELQLLIAAPSADDSTSGTTYSLTRHVDPIMGEQVTVRGLRGFGQKVEAREPTKTTVAVPIWNHLESTGAAELS